MTDAGPTLSSDRPPTHGGPGRAVATWWRRDARFDVPASLVVFLVAVPLSLGIAVASGAPVAAGLIAAAVGGIVAGMVGGSPLQVSGPAAGLTVVVAETINSFGFGVTCAITAVAGMLQVVLGLGRVGRFALAISPTVVRAMLAGIGLSILLGQLNVALGSSSSPTALENVENLGTALGGLDVQALVAASLVVVTLLAWPRLPLAVRRVPGPLVAVAGTTVVAALVLPDAERVDLGGSLLSQIGLPPMPDVSWLAFAGAVITICLIASVESLLSAVAVDKLQDGPRSKLDRELVGQGAANSLSGLLGGLPVTGVIVRSATNVAAGARTRVSAVLHGVWVLVFSLLLVGLVEQIPLAALAGLLVVMGAQLVKPSDMREARQRGELWVYVVTAALVLLLNLVEGVMIGLAAAVLVLLWRVARVRVDAQRHGDAPDGREMWIVEVRGTLSFLAAPRIIKGLNAVPDGQVVEIDLLVDYVDPASEEQVQQWRTRYEAAGGTVEVERPGASADAPGKADPVTSRAWMPWSTWQSDHDDRTLGATRHLATGIREFHRRTAHSLRPSLERMRESQHPDAFFMSCTDSRVVPNLLTSSGPGDLFTVRTMGNIAPVAGSPDASVSAPLVYAVDELEVPTVVVCGHSGCGAMTAAVAGAPVEPGGPVDRWLSHAGPAVEAWRAGHPVGAAAAEAGDGDVDQLGQVNVAVTLDRLRDELGPERAARVTFVGLFFRVADGTVWMLRDERFVPLTDAEMSELAPAR